jgi:lysyl-tRNA synthetase class 2
MSQDTTPTNALESQRRENRAAVAALGLNPYGIRTDGISTALEARALHNTDADQSVATHGKEPGFNDPRAKVTVAGRVTLLRDNGKLIWIQIRDHTGDIQAAVSQRDVNETDFKFAKLTDLADIIIVTGRVMKTKTGEITVWAEKIQPGSKCVAPPPAKHEGLQDVELRYRQRYVDLWSNPETMSVFRTRSRMIAEMRKFFEGRGYEEVETPMLQSLAGGAAARPFVTHMNALSINLFMRIAPELFLKRLLVGGMPKVFEINRNFRNEGLDKRHNPEFTVVEAYEAFGDYHTMMELVESLVRHLATFVGRETGAGSDLKLPFGDWNIDYGTPFRKVTYADLFKEALGFEMTDIARCRDECAKRKLKHVGLDDVLVVNELFEEVAEKSIDPAKPTFVMDYPSAISPLTRPSAKNPAIAERWDLFIGGMEIGPAYTELNDPDIQEAKFREQLKGLDDDKNAEENTFRTMDHDFLRALRVGMPPAGGMGLGIDRLVMLLTNRRTIRDVILFPMMRPEGSPDE